MWWFPGKKQQAGLTNTVSSLHTSHFFVKEAATPSGAQVSQNVHLDLWF